jgi:hypothetical protein
MRYHAGMNHYTYPPEHREYVGRCIELPWQQAVDEFVAERTADGEEVPAPLSERQYSGKFVVRTSPALHARLVIEAAEQKLSMNQWVVQELSGRLNTGLGALFNFD